MNKISQDLIKAYEKIKPEIRKRIGEFRKLKDASDEKIFSEMCYCILTANANALRCNEAIGELEKRGLIARGSAGQIRPHIKGRARFHNKKADYIVGARKLFNKGGSINIKAKLDPKDIMNVREWLVNNIKGFGYKEASHFLRNIGLGRDIAILDRHILKNLQKHGVIDKIPSSLGSRRIYLEIEEKMRAFSKRIGIPLEDMDLLFWSIQTGFVFK